MRIAMISTPFISVPPATYGGTELIVYELVQGLIDAGHEVTLFATGDSRTRAELRFLYPRPAWPPNPLIEINHVSWAMREIADEDFDLIHAHSAFALAMSRLLPHVPLIYTIHHTLTKEFSDFYLSFPEIQYIAISQRQKDLEVSMPHCEVIYHGLNPNHFGCSATAENYVCFVARFAEIKGPHLAIDVAKEAGVPIYIAGESHAQDREFFFEEMEWRLHLPHVTYLGCIGISQKSLLLKRARALLAPIDWEEPFGIILIEAMLSGCPVVAFPRGSVPELIEPGITGFIVHSFNEMVDAIRPGGPVDFFDRQLCRNRAKKLFSRTRLVTDHVRLYERLIGDHLFDAQPSEGVCPK